MKIRIVKTITLDGVTYPQNENGWLWGVKWDKEGDFTYYVDIKGKRIGFDKKHIDFD